MLLQLSTLIPSVYFFLSEAMASLESLTLAKNLGPIIRLIKQVSI